MRRLAAFLISLMLVVSTGCRYSSGPVPILSSAPVGRLAPARKNQATVAKKVSHKTKPVYNIKDIGTLSQCDTSHGMGINNSGEVVGYVQKQTQSYGFIYQDGKLRALTSGLCTSVAKAINNHGVITGWIEPSASPMQAFIYSGHKMHILSNLRGLPEGQGTFLNDRGEVTGYVTDGDVSYAFLNQHGKMQFLTKPPPEPGYTEANAINNRGLIVGQTGLFKDTANAAFFPGRKADDLNHLLPKSSGWRLRTADAINNSSWITGVGNHDGKQHAFLFRYGKVIDIGRLPNRNDSDGLALNNQQQVVGISGNHAFLYSQGRLADLNDLIPADSGWILNVANGINDKGQIVGTGKHNSKVRAFVLTPIGS